MGEKGEERKQPIVFLLSVNSELIPLNALVGLFIVWVCIQMFRL